MGKAKCLVSSLNVWIMHYLVLPTLIFTRKEWTRGNFTASRNSHLGCHPWRDNQIQMERSLPPGRFTDRLEIAPEEALRSTLLGGFVIQSV